MDDETYQTLQTEAGMIRSQLALHNKGYEKLSDEKRMKLEIELSYLEHQLDRSGVKILFSPHSDL